MPTVHTRSATPLDPILLEPRRDATTHVWLRKNIVETLSEEAGDTGSDPVPMWEADEVYFHATSPVVLEEIEEHFEALWLQFSHPLPPAETSVDARLSDVELALAELAGLLGGV